MCKSLKKLGEPGRTRTSNPLLDQKMLSSWLFKHFLVSYITVYGGVRQGSVPKLVPTFRRTRVQRGKMA